MDFGIFQILQSTGPIALGELTTLARSPQELTELIQGLQALIRQSVVTVTGPKAADLAKMTPEEITAASQDIASSSDTIVALSQKGLRRSLA